MQDLYEYNQSVFPHLFGGAKYVFENRKYSQGFISRIAEDFGIQITFTQYGSHKSGDFEKDRMISRAMQETSFYTPPDPTQTPPPEVSTGDVSIRKNEEKNGIEVKFPSKPAPEVIDYLKANGFRWSKFQSLWYARHNDSLLNQITERLQAA